MKKLVLGFLLTLLFVTGTGSAHAQAAASISGSLDIGSRGDAVTTLQQFLITKGFLKTAAPTGYFGSMTAKAVMGFQAVNSLPQVGRVGPKTLALLNAQLSSNGTAQQASATGLCPNGNTSASNCATGPVVTVPVQSPQPSPSPQQATVPQERGTLSVAPDSSYSNPIVNPNTAGVEIGSYTLTNNSATDSYQVSQLSLSLPSSQIPLNDLSNLIVKMNGTQFGVTTAKPNSNLIILNQFSDTFTLAPGQPETITIYADLGPSFGVLNTALSGSAEDMTTYVSSGFKQATGQSITIDYQESCSVSPKLVIANSTVSQYIPVGTTIGAANGTMAEFNFSTTAGPPTINELKFNVSGSTTASSITVNGTTAPVVNGVADATGLAINVPSGGVGTTVDVYVSYPPVGMTGIPSGSLSKITLTYVNFTCGSFTTTSFPSITTPTMNVVGSMPTITVGAPTTPLAKGNVEAIDVTVAANAAGPVMINQIPITMNTTGSSGAPSLIKGGAIVVKDQNGSIISTATGVVAASSGGTSIINFAGGYMIPSGTTQLFEIFVPVSSVGTGTLPNTYLNTALGSASSFSWTDSWTNTAESHATPLTSENAMYYYNYPTNTVSVHN